jgi:hypothetical protein
MRAQLVYDWEANHVEPGDRTFLSREAARALVVEACRFLGIKVPEIQFINGSMAPCSASITRWKLRITEWGRTRVTLLHEVAHLGSAEAVRAGEDGHGPTFLAVAISLYSRFLGLDEQTLITSARRVGLSVGDAPSAKRRSFLDIDF